MHLWCISAKTRKEIADSGVATTFLHPFQGRGAHGGPEEMENVEYVGWVKEIVELDLKYHYVVVLVCDWIKAYYSSANQTIKRDDFGFISAKVLIDSLMDFGLESFAFRIHVQKGFFSEDNHQPG